MGWAETKPTRPRDLLYSSERTLELPYYPDRDSKKPKHRYWVADTAQPGYEPAPPLPYFDWDRFAEGNPELAALDPFRLSQGVGFGYKVSYYGYAWQFPGRTNAYYDFTKNQVYPLHEGQKRMRAILPSTWVLQERVGEDTYLALYDPETQAAHPAPGLQANDQFVCATKSGCFLFERGQELFQFDPETQAVSTVTQLGRLLHEKHRAGEMSYSKLPIGGPSPPYLALGGDSYSHSKQIGWFDEQTLTLHWGAPIERSFQLIRFGEDAKAIGISMGRLIERIDWKTGERETLFPRPENIGGL